MPFNQGTGVARSLSRAQMQYLGHAPSVQSISQMKLEQDQRPERRSASIASSNPKSTTPDGQAVVGSVDVAAEPELDLDEVRFRACCMR